MSSISDIHPPRHILGVLAMTHHPVLGVQWNMPWSIFMETSLALSLTFSCSFFVPHVGSEMLASTGEGAPQFRLLMFYCVFF